MRKVNFKKTVSIILILAAVAFISFWALRRNSHFVDIQGGISYSVDAEEARGVVLDFGKQLQKVSLLAPKDILTKNMRESYGELVSQELIEKWIKDPQNAPGRLVSSPRPDRIEILSIEQISKGKYKVEGEIIEVTSEEAVSGGVFSKRPITLTVKKTNKGWLIVDVVLGESERADVQGFIDSKPTPDKIIKYLSENITNKNADVLILALEDAQNRILPDILSAYEKPDVQKAFIENSTSSISGLLERAKQNGFKTESSEGMYYPVIDYSIYKAWRDKASDDIKSYILIMSKQSENPTAKDAALVISWEELLNRTIEMEAFVKNYSNSERFNKINEMYGYYKSFVFSGLNNTPLFDYATSQVSKEALAAFKNTLEGITNSELADSLQEYIQLIEKNNYMLTDEVKEFRESIFK